ncbi:MAG: hypothetical protein EAZ51_09305 [Sphingobacteriales bacterium]|nr:MAG: hypothetical protein EAZ64_02955 [Sphingobacteriales bacterium]TAF78555.1 MAG: hypothetical protein EAZ51_09305 [Sphingobacteriales bacterium]
MKKLLLLCIICTRIQLFAQNHVKDLTYFYYKLDKDPSFNDYLKAKREFNERKNDFVLPASKEAVKEITEKQHKILKNQKNYANFLSKYGMKNAHEYAILWYKQAAAFKEFSKQNPEFNKLTEKEQSNVIDKWYFTPIEKYEFKP